MIIERHFDLKEDKAPVELYFDDNGWPMDKPNTSTTLGEFECPECHADTFGVFAPFVKRGILRWCSSCGYSEYDREKQAAWQKEHPLQFVNNE